MLNKLPLLVFLICAFTLRTACAQVLSNQSPRVIVVLGSSTAFGYGTNPIDSSFVNKLRKNLHSYNRKDTIINLAVPGYTTYDIQPNGSNPPPDPAANITYALTKKPNLVIINMPTNDINNNYSDTQIINNYKTVVKLLTDAKVQYIITSTQPRDFSAEQRARLRPFTNLTISTFGSSHVIDYLDQLSNPDYTIRDSLAFGDGIHVNNKGHKIIYDAFINFPLYKQMVNFNQKITFNTPAQKAYGDADFDAGAVASSGLPVTYTSSNAAVATVLNGKIHITGIGSSIITASQPGNSQYLPATSVAQTLTVKAAAPAITSFSPQNAITGSTVTITGTNFDNATAVNFGPVPADSFKVVSSTTITAVVGQGATGAVSLTTPGGTAIQDGFNYVFNVSADDFKVAVTSATCKGSKDGSIHIDAKAALNYTATITGNGINDPYPFNIAADINNLAAGTYSLCIGVERQYDFNQCFTIVIDEPKDLSVYSTVTASNNLNLQLSGANLYNISLNGVSYSTKNSSFTLPLTANSNQITVTTDKLCQGVFQKVINITGNSTPYPNPFLNTLNLNLGSQVQDRVNVQISDMSDGKLIYTRQYTGLSGVLQLDLSSLKGGLYALHLSSGNLDKVFKIMKQ